MDGATALLTAVLGGAAALVTAWALLVRAKGDADNPKQLLRRLWDWLEGTSLHEDVPPTLANEIRKELEDGDAG